MKNKLVFGGLISLLVLTAIEIIFYFFTLFRPWVSKGVPSESNIFNQILFSPFVTPNDRPKTFYSQRLDDFTKSLSSLMSSSSSFVKTTDASYMIGGEVVESKFVDDKTGVNSSYVVTFKNSGGDTYVDRLNSSEINNATVFIRTISEHGFSRIPGTLGDIKPGEFYYIKRSINLLDPAEVTIEIEVIIQN